MNNNRGNSNMPPSYSPSDGSASSPVSQQQTRRTAGSRARRNHQQNLQHHSQQNQPLDQTRLNQTRLNQTRVEPASILPPREDMYQPNYNNAYRTGLNPTPGMENYDNSYDNSTENHQSYSPQSGRVGGNGGQGNRVNSANFSDSSGNSGFSGGRFGNSGGNFGNSNSGLSSAGANFAQGSSGKKRNVFKIVRRTLLFLIIAFLLFAIFLVFTINKNLHHEKMLTGRSDDNATTWLLLGSDARDGTAGGTADDIPGYRTDTILMLTKPQSGKSSLISIPRDSLVTVNGTYMKINAVAMTAGWSALTGAVETITGLKVDHVVLMGFAGVENIVNALGTVDLCYDYDVDDPDSQMHWKAGCHASNGAEALAFSRMRYADPKGDFGRNDRQRQVISAISKKTASPSVFLNPFKLKKVSDAGLNALTVDENANVWSLYQMMKTFRSATGDGGITGSVYYTNPGYSVASLGSCVLLNDQKNLDLFKQLADGTYSSNTAGGLSS